MLFQDRLATVAGVLDGSRADLDAALTNLSGAMVDVQRFVAGSRDQAAEQVARLGDVVRNISENQMVLKNLLHVAPNAIGNSYNIYNPDIQSALGGFALANFSNPLQVVCAAIGAIENVTAGETGKLCSQYLGPALRLLNFNYLPMPFNALSGQVAEPVEPDLPEPELAPGGRAARRPREIPPDISAYTGLRGMSRRRRGGPTADPRRGAYAPDGLPADPQPALFPGARFRLEPRTVR